MNYLLEFAKFRDILKSDNVELIRDINKPFNNDEQLIYDVFLERNNKHIFIKWFNTKEHLMINRVKQRTSFKSTSEFNEFIENVINQLFIKHIKEIDNSGRYALYMLENGFYLMVDINYDNLFSEYTQIFITTIVTSSAYDVYKKIVINDENF